MVLLPWALACLVPLFPYVKANWEISAEGQTCDQTCTAKTATCSQDGNRQLNSNFEFDYVFADLVGRGQIPPQFSACDRYQRLTDTAVQAQPGTLYFADLNLTPTCYQYAAESTCAGSSGNVAFRRFCCCMTNAGDDFSQACFVPTTTTSTQTTQTTTSVTTMTQTTATTSTTETSTSSTATTTTISTSATTTSTLVTITTTQTTQTTSTVTGTTVTMTGTGTESTSTVTSSSSTATTVTMTSSTTTTTETTTTETTTTIVTQTLTTITTSFTSYTTTSSTTTVTAAASTLITAFVPAGSTDIPIADSAGFSEGDVILLRNREVVEIQNITEDSGGGGGRRLDEDARILAGVPATLTVTPAISRDYNPGDSIRNLGPSATYTGSDPITFHGGQKIKFWLPNHQEFMMLETSELKVFGQVFPGPKPDQQWFGSFRVVLSDDTPVVEVNIRRPAANHSKVTRCSSRRMDSMDVFLGRSRSSLLEVQGRPMEFTAGDDVRFAIDCRQQDRPLLASSRTEYIHFETPSIGFLIVAAHAGNEFPDDWRLQLKYMHLDLLILEMPRKNEFRGILPEIWGILPRSQEVEAMLSPPETAQENTELAPRVCQEDQQPRQTERGADHPSLCLG